MPVVTERLVWAIKVVIEATEEQAAMAEEAIARALCPDEHHPGYCPVPWSTLRVALADLDDDERAGWREDFDEQGRRAREAGAEET